MDKHELGRCYPQFWLVVWWIMQDKLVSFLQVDEVIWWVLQYNIASFLQVG